MAVKIRALNIWKTYPSPDGPLPVIEGIDLTVDEGEFVALIGPSGCGKSTLLHMLTGFERPDRGTVTVDGKPLEGPSRKGILISQKGSVFPWLTVRRNLTFILNGLDQKERQRLASHYVRLVGLEGFEKAFPWQLSGGMLQRVELARALVVKPDILYMDEPLGALDALTRFRMRTELLRILSRERHTCLLVTHDVEEALQLADRIIVLSPRPARIQTILEVSSPYPRVITSLPMVKLKDQILKELGL